MPATASEAQEVRVEPYSYDLAGAKVEGELGRLVIPQHHAKPNGPKIELAFVRLKSTSATPGPPIVYLAGGPGGSGIALAKGPRGASFLRMREAGDVIALDQRGTGLSSPNLDCPGTVDLPLPATREEVASRLSVASRDCARQWRQKGVDLSAYNVVESARDLDALRRALGVKQIILWGSSYGTQLGLSTIRHHGSGIARAVFSGVEGPDHTLKLSGIVDRQLQAADHLVPRTAADPLNIVAARVLAAAERRPFSVSVPGQDSSAARVVRLGRFELEETIAALIGTRADLARLPGILTALDQGDLDSTAVRQVAQQFAATRKAPLGSAMAFATDCSSGASPARRRQAERENRTALVAELDFPVPTVCPAWGVPELPEQERAPVRSRIPVLFLSGSLDGRTPPSNADEVARGFPNSRQILIEGAGHGHELFISSPMIDAATLTFIRSGRTFLDHIVLPPPQARP